MFPNCLYRFNKSHSSFVHMRFLIVYKFNMNLSANNRTLHISDLNTIYNIRTRFWRSCCTQYIYTTWYNSVERKTKTRLIFLSFWTNYTECKVHFPLKIFKGENYYENLGQNENSRTWETLFFFCYKLTHRNFLQLTMIF